MVRAGLQICFHRYLSLGPCRVLVLDFPEQLCSVSCAVSGTSTTRLVLAGRCRVLRNAVDPLDLFQQFVKVFLRGWGMFNPRAPRPHLYALRGERYELKADQRRQSCPKQAGAEGLSRQVNSLSIRESAIHLEPEVAILVSMNPHRRAKR